MTPGGQEAAALGEAEAVALSEGEEGPEEACPASWTFLGKTEEMPEIMISQNGLI